MIKNYYFIDNKGNYWNPIYNLKKHLILIGKTSFN